MRLCLLKKETNPKSREIRRAKMSLKVNYEVYVYLNKIGRKYTAATINVYLCLTYMNTYT